MCSLLQIKSAKPFSAIYSYSVWLFSDHSQTWSKFICISSSSIGYNFSYFFGFVSNKISIYISSFIFLQNTSVNGLLWLFSIIWESFFITYLNLFIIFFYNYLLWIKIFILKKHEIKLNYDPNSKLSYIINGYIVKGDIVPV